MNNSGVSASLPSRCKCIVWPMRSEQKCRVRLPRNLLKGKEHAFLLSFLHLTAWNSPMMAGAPATILGQEKMGQRTIKTPNGRTESRRISSLWWLCEAAYSPRLLPSQTSFCVRKESLGVFILRALLQSAKHSSSLIQHHKIIHTGRS